MAESGDDAQKTAQVGAADTGGAFFPVDGLGVQIEGVVIDDLFGLFRGDSMAGDMIAIGIIPVKS